MNDEHQPTHSPEPGDGPQTRNVTVLNRYGIHARPAALLVKAASKHPCEIFIEKDGVRVNAKSIMGLLTLEGHCGAAMILWASGPNAAEALDELVALFQQKFFEE